MQIDVSEARTAEALAGAELGRSRSEVTRAEARWEEARGKLQRLESGGSWIAAQELEAARSAERMAQADLHAARASVGMGRARVARERLRSRRHTFEAPFDGVLVSSEVDRGDSVHAGQTLARVIDDRRQVRFALPREQLPTSGTLEVSLALPSGSVAARLHTLQPEVDPAAQMIFATATPVHADQLALMPGTRVQVTAVADVADNAQNGRLVAVGRHADLLLRAPAYQALIRAQNGPLPTSTPSSLASQQQVGGPHVAMQHAHSVSTPTLTGVPIAPFPSVPAQVRARVAQSAALDLTEPLELSRRKR